MKKFIKIGILGILLLLCFTGCKKRLYIYNYAYYIPQSIIKDFEKQYHVTVIYDVFSSESEMYAKIKAGAIGYDIVCAPADYVQIMKKQGILKKIDHSKLTVLPNFNPILLKKTESFDPGNQYSLPYVAGAAGIIVNRNKVHETDIDFSIFNNKRYKGKMTLLDTMRDTFGAALFYNHDNINTRDEKDLIVAKNQLQLWRENLLKFDSDSYGKLFSSGVVDIVYGFPENVFLELTPTQMAHTEVIFPKGKGPMYIDNLVMPNGGNNSQAAYDFFNFLYTPREYAKLLDYLRVPSIINKTEHYSKIKSIYTLADIKDYVVEKDVGSAIRLYNALWYKVKVGDKR